MIERPRRQSPCLADGVGAAVERPVAPSSPDASRPECSVVRELRRSKSMVSHAVATNGAESTKSPK